MEKVCTASHHVRICGVEARSREQSHTVKRGDKQETSENRFDQTQCQYSDFSRLVKGDAARHKNPHVLPAMHALTRDTHVPVIMARNTMDEMSPLLGGHIEASWERKTNKLVSLTARETTNCATVAKYSHRPPITIPRELKLAKPQRP